MDKKYLKQVAVYFLTTVVSLGVMLYIGYHLFYGLTQKVDTEPALISTVSFRLTADAYIFRDEILLESTGQTDGRNMIERIRAQIEYEILVQRYSREQLDELVEIMLEVAMNRSPNIRLGRDAEYPTHYVQQRFEKITSMHIEKVMDGIQENRTRVYNTKAYLMTALFNSVSTIDHHYSMLYNHDCGNFSSP